MASVALRGVRKAYGRGPEVVRGVDLAVADGELVVLVGPSGCGKSTLLNIVAGLEAPTAGDVLIDGAVVTRRAPGERDVAMVFQSYALYPHMTVAKNLAFPLEVARVPRAEVDARVRETAARLDIAHLLDRRPRELSGGQRQRVALGRALVRRPRVFLFDEPLSNLDAALRARTRAELKKLHEELRATFVYVTHDQAEAMTLADRVVVLHEGRVQQAAAPREVYERPANTFVAGFFGAPPINLVPPRVLGLAAPGGRDALVGVRPEDVAVDCGAAPPGALGGRVYLVEPFGAETWVTVAVGDARVVARAPATFAAATGAAAWVRPDLARAVWFDAATGARVG